MAKDHTNYYYVRCSAFAELDGEQVDITGFKVIYALDEIPRAEIYPTVGRDPANDKEAAAVEKFLAVEQYTPIKIKAKFETEDDSPAEDEGFPYNEDVLVFDGYVMDSTYVMSRSPGGGGMQLVCHAASWLTALAGTDSNIAGVTAKGPGGWDELVNPSTEDAGLNIFDIQSFMVVDAENSVVDLWGEYIKKVFLSIVNVETIWGNSPNDSADDALNKMDDDEVFNDEATNVLPLRFGESGGSKEQKELFLGEYVAQSVGRILLDQWRDGGSSLWDTLMSCAKAFGFHVVPLIETAACCPVYGALAGDPYKTITANDYNSINLSSAAQMMVTKYVIIAAGSSYSVTRSPTPRESGHIGIYDISTMLPQGDSAKGQTIVAQAPAWLAYEAEIGDIVRDSLGGDALAVPTADNADAFEKEPETDSQQVYNDLLNDKLGDYFAQARLQEANLNPRYGSLGGRFRLDIAPGSTVKFEVIDDKFADEDAEPKYMYALVTQVVLDLTAGRTGPSGSASTIFSLNYVRTEEEHKKDYMTAQKHPVWSGTEGEAKFLGTKLWKG